MAVGTCSPILVLPVFKLPLVENDGGAVLHRHFFQAVNHVVQGSGNTLQVCFRFCDVFAHPMSKCHCTWQISPHDGILLAEETRC